MTTLSPPSSFPAAADMPDAVWAAIRSAARAGDELSIAVPEPWRSLFGPLCRPDFVLGQLGQSLDGRIATPAGHSHYINGPKAIVHLHRLRALVDAVVVGVGTVLADDPLLSVRHVEGRNPARAAIDPRGRVPHDAKLLTADGCRRFILTQQTSRDDLSADIEIVPIRVGPEGRFQAQDMLAALRARGLRRILIEGGAATLSDFIAQGALDRLHLVVAPLIIGSGQVGLNLPPIDTLDAAIRPPAGIYNLGSDVLFDCALGTP